jgi:hypothetical protein
VNIVAIVEGAGDLTAVPQLLTQIGLMVGDAYVASKPIRGGEWRKIRRDGELERLLALAYSRNPDHICVIVDLDDDCAAQEYTEAQERIRAWKNGREISVGLAFLVREFEVLFLEQIERVSDGRVRSLPENVVPAETRDAKGTLRRLARVVYKESQDQVRLTKKLDLPTLYRQNRSFRKLCKEVFCLTYPEVEEIIF